MSKKRKRGHGGSGEAHKPQDAGAVEEASSVDELQADVPTRTGEQLADADEAARELGDDARTSVRAGPRPVPTDADETMRVERISEDHRFDFGRPEDVTPDASGFVPPDPTTADAASPRLQSILESLLFAADRPLSLKALAELVDETDDERVRAAVAAIELAWRDRGVQLHEVAGGHQFRTHPANAVWVQKLLQQKPVRLSRALLETLAICAYRQPITRPEIDEIRGVDSGGTLKTLMDRALVRILGKKEEPGRPLLYGTTREFLEFFSLRDLKDLPTLREYHELSEEHRAQVAALEGKAPEGAIVAEGEEGDGDELAADSVPRLSRLEIAPQREDAAELAEIDRLIRTAGVATDSDLPSVATVEGDAALADETPEERAVTGRFEPMRRDGGEAAREFDDDRARTGTFGDPLPEPELAAAADFEAEEATSIRPRDVDASLVDGRDPDKEPAA